jgi:SEC-C motif
VHGEKELLEKLGRNDLCPCGSGRKFKKCCLRCWSLRWQSQTPLFSGTSNQVEGTRFPPKSDYYREVGLDQTIATRARMAVLLPFGSWAVSKLPREAMNPFLAVGGDHGSRRMVPNMALVQMGECGKWSVPFATGKNCSYSHGQSDSPNIGHGCRASAPLADGELCLFDLLC